MNTEDWSLADSGGPQVDDQGGRTSFKIIQYQFVNWDENVPFADSIVLRDLK